MTTDCQGLLASVNGTFLIPPPPPPPSLLPRKKNAVGKISSPASGLRLVCNNLDVLSSEPGYGVRIPSEVASAAKLLEVAVKLASFGNVLKTDQEKKEFTLSYRILGLSAAIYGIVLTFSSHVLF